MRMTIGQLRRLIRETVNEVRMLSEGGLPEDWQEAQEMLQGLLDDVKQTASVARAIKDEDSPKIPELEKMIGELEKRVSQVDPALLGEIGWETGMYADLVGRWEDDRRQESHTSFFGTDDVVSRLRDLAEEIVTKFGDEYDLKGNMGESRLRSRRR